MNSLLQVMVRLKQGLVRVLEVVVIVLMATLVLDVLWQVVSRYVVGRPSSWTDELATLLVIWLALLGASVAFGRKAHLGVDFLVRQLTAGQQRGLRILVQAVIVFFAVTVLILGGIHLVMLAWMTGQVSPALGVNMGHVYLALPISGVFIALFGVEAVLEAFSSKSDSVRQESPGPSPEEDA